LWFGEFIHGLMEEAYREWRDEPKKRRFPWLWESDIRNVEAQINDRLIARGLPPPPNLFCPFDSSATTPGFCPDANHPHKLIASQRAEMAINTWGMHLFPIIAEAEVKLKCSRDMPSYHPNLSRSNYYGMKGVIDVISSVSIVNAPSGSLLLHYLNQHSDVQHYFKVSSLDEYEIIVDYKGMRRPSFVDETWKHHEWQILTYSWLRSQQVGAKQIIAGILIYINELALSIEDMLALKNDINQGQTDIMATGKDLENIQRWNRRSNLPSLSRTFKENRSIRIIPVNKSAIGASLSRFDQTVEEIEASVLAEIAGVAIRKCWKTNQNIRTCTACDFKNFCPAQKQSKPTVP